MKILRINKVSSNLINQINQLFDDKKWDEQQGNIFLSDQNNLFLLAFEDDKPVGFLTAHRLQRFDKRKAEILLYEIGVHQDYRRKGVGKSLINEVKKWANEVGAAEIWVLTEKTNPAAISLYQSVGGKEESPGTIMYVYKINE
jgi:ribosomal protein S18 acetylase RimI-like enzyme